MTKEEFFKKVETYLPTENEYHRNKLTEDIINSLLRSVAEKTKNDIIEIVQNSDWGIMDNDIDAKILLKDIDDYWNQQNKE